MKHTSLRHALVQAARAMNDRGLNRGTSGNLSARVPEGMLITPSAVPYDRLDAAAIILMDLDGHVVEGDGKPSTGWRLHAGVLRDHPEADAVLHAHSPFATTIACLGRDIPAFHYMVAVAGGDSIRCAPYATFGTPELAGHALAALDGRRACLLANHGLVALGSSPAAALDLAAEVESLAEQYWRALQLGEPRILSAAQMADVHDRFRDYRAPAASPGTPSSTTAFPTTRLAGAPPETPPPAAAPAAARTAPTEPPRVGERPVGARRASARPPIDWGDVGQRWMGRIGALLLLVGLGYLMKFAVDQGWLGPPLRIAFGAAIGLALLAAGLRSAAGKRLYALTLMGTGLATLYLTGYAAYALYHYLGPVTAFIALAGVTALSLVLARRRAEQTLAQIGAAGAFATPLLLGEAGGVPALSLYVVGVAGWTGALAFVHGWRSLFGTILVGAMGLLAVGADEAAAGEALPVSLAGVWVWAVVAALPLLRERLPLGRLRRPARPVPRLLQRVVVGPERLDRLTAAALVPLATIPLVALQAALWDLGRSGAAAVAFAAAAVIAALLVGPAHHEGAVRARTAGSASLLLVHLGASLLLPDEAARVALLAAGGVAAFLGPGLARARGAAAMGHLFFALLGAWIAAQPSNPLRPIGFATPLAAAELGAILAAVLVALRALEPVERRVYLVAAHVAALVWAMVCSRDIPGGLAWLSFLWGVYGAALMILAVARNLPAVRLAALATLGLVAAKLLLVDTAGVGAGWRIILFIGFGAAFLALGYISSPDETTGEVGAAAARPEDAGDREAGA